MVKIIINWKIYKQNSYYILKNQKKNVVKKTIGHIFDVKIKPKNKRNVSQSSTSSLNYEPVKSIWR